MRNVYDILEERGYIEQVTHDGLREWFDKEKVSFYIGFDPTADSLHIGHFVSAMVASHMQKAGHKPIILIGGGTGMIGDPSGRTDMRSMMTRETVQHNVECFKKQLSKFVSFEGENAAIIVDNADWLLKLNYIEFMRDIGAYFSVNRMLTADCYKRRLEKGLTFLEFSYMLMQAYDFLELYKRYNCSLEIGGNDQWSNILAGADLIRRKEQGTAFGLTFKLLLTSEGIKMGKTAKGALWLDPEKTSPYEFYQYFRNVADADVKNTMCLLTFLPMEQVNALCDVEGEKINEAKKVLAYEITKIVHGEEEAKKAQDAAEALFGGSGNLESMPSTKIEALPISITDLLVATKLAPSKGQARTLIEQGGIAINDEKITDTNYMISEINDYIVIKKGKKTFHKVEI
ncbi:MAG: tyrosine--tRNA ligase [Clostridia bacterium]|nr:tyrosine--tRNA ligase [Clostridia bacterium]